MNQRRTNLTSGQKPAAANGGLYDIAVVDWKPYEKGCLRGFLSVNLAQTIRVNDLKLFDKNGSRWISLPTKEYTKRDGSKGYAPLVEFGSKEAEREFQEAALAALDRYHQENDDE
jgi:hypothetical protein